MTLFGNLATSKLISNWFKKKIGSAIGYATLGISLSGVFIPPISVYLISLYGWRATYIIFGIFLIVFFVPFCRYLIVNKPSDINQNVDNEKLSEEIDNSVTDKMMNIVDILRVPTFWILILIFSLQFCANLGVYSHIFPYACLLYTSPSPRDMRRSRMPSSA